MFGSEVQVVVLLALIVFAASVPLPGFPPVHVIAPDVVLSVDFELVDAAPSFDIPGAAKVNVPGPPVHVVVPAAKLLPVVATCAAPNEITGTALRTATVKILRNTIPPHFLLEADRAYFEVLDWIEAFARAAMFAAPALHNHLGRA